MTLRERSGNLSRISCLYASRFFFFFFWAQGREAQFQFQRRVPKHPNETDKTQPEAPQDPPRPRGPRNGVFGREVLLSPHAATDSAQSRRLRARELAARKMTFAAGGVRMTNGSRRPPMRQACLPEGCPPFPFAKGPNFHL